MKQEKLNELYDMCLVFHNNNWDRGDGGAFFDDATEFLYELHDLLLKDFNKDE